MAVRQVAIGGLNVHFHVTAYNCKNAAGRMYCEFLTRFIEERAGELRIEQVHEWIRANLPDYAGLVDAIERGESPPREAPIGSHPFTPGQEAFEAPIIGHLKDQQRRRGGHVRSVGS
jgi:hypothetical protein